jgi:hypothetical protein
VLGDGWEERGVLRRRRKTRRFPGGVVRCSCARSSEREDSSLQEECGGKYLLEGKVQICLLTCQVFL